jgi:hypothetical protein
MNQTFGKTFFSALALFAAFLLNMAWAGPIRASESTGEILNKSMKRESLSPDSLLSLLDGDAYLSLALTRKTMTLPAAEAQNQGNKREIPQDLMALLAAPPAFYNNFANRQVENSVSATGLIEGKSTHTCLAHFTSPLPRLAKLLDASKKENQDCEIKLEKSPVFPGLTFLSWNDTRYDTWYATTFGEHTLLLTTSKKVLVDCARAYKTPSKCYPKLLERYKEKLQADAPHIQINAIGNEDAPPVLMQIQKVDDSLKIEMLTTSPSAENEKHLQRLRRGLEESAGQAMTPISPFTFNQPGGTAALREKQKKMMAELSPYMAHHFGLLKSKESR